MHFKIFYLKLIYILSFFSLFLLSLSLILILLPDKFGYVLDPHGAVGLVGLKRNLHKNDVGVFFETAHPIKFLNSINKIIKLRENFFNISSNFNSEERFYSIKNNYKSLIKFIESIN